MTATTGRTRRRDHTTAEEWVRGRSRLSRSTSCTPAAMESDIAERSERATRGLAAMESGLGGRSQNVVTLTRFVPDLGPVLESGLGGRIQLRQQLRVHAALGSVSKL
jgi:hypothetical protein